MKSNLFLAIAGGLLAALVGAAIWAVVTVSTEYQIGWMAVGVGALVGFAVRTLGKGSTPVYGVIGAVCALLGCVLGNLYSGIGFIAESEGISYMDAVLNFDYGYSFDVLQAMASPMDLLFYGIAVYEGFKFGIAPEQA